MTTITLTGPLKAKWFQMHCRHYFVLNSKSFKSILFGDSLIVGLSHYCKIWNNFFKPIDALHCSREGDKVTIKKRHHHNVCINFTLFD